MLSALLTPLGSGAASGAPTAASTSAGPATPSATAAVGSASPAGAAAPQHAHVLAALTALRDARLRSLEQLSNVSAATHPAAGGSPSTVWTIGVANESLEPGNQVPVNALAPAGVAYVSSGDQVFVADWSSDTVSVLSAISGRVLATIEVGAGPTGLVYAPGPDEVFVADQSAGTVSVLSAASDTLVGTIDVGSEPTGVAYDPGRAEVFVTNNGSQNVSILSALSNKVVGAVGVGMDPSAAAYADGSVYVADWGAASLSVVSDLTDHVTGTIGVGSGPDALAYDPTTDSLFVANSGSDTVSVVAEANDSVVATIDVGNGPDALTVDPTTGDAFVTTAGSDNVSIISTSTDALAGTVAVGPGPDGLAADTVDGTVFVANALADNLSEIAESSARVVASLPLGSFPIGAALDSTSGSIYVASSDADVLTTIAPANQTPFASTEVGVGAAAVAYDSGRGELFVANNASNTVSVVSASTGKVVATVDVGIGPEAVVYDSARGEVFVANSNNSSDSVSVISDTTDTVVATVPVGVGPAALAYDPGRNEVFVANNGSGTVSVISDSSDQVVATVTVGESPDGLAYDAGSHQVFVANGGADTVSVISDATDTVATTVPVGFLPAGLAYDSGRGEVFVANEASDNVSVVSDASDEVVATVNVGLSPRSAVYDPALSEVYVTDPGSGTVSVIADGTTQPYSAVLKVSVTNSSGDAVSGADVSVDGQSGSSNAMGSVQFIVANGTYNLSATADGYLPTWTTVDVQGSDSAVLTLGYPYDFLGTIPPLDLDLTAVYGGVNVSLLSPFNNASASDVFFDWKLVGEIPVHGGWTNFLTPGLPGLIVVAAAHHSADYPDAYYAYPSQLADTGCGAVPATMGPLLPITVNPDPPVYGSPTLVTVGLHDSCTYPLHIDELIIQIANFNLGGATYTTIATEQSISLAANAYDNVSVLWNTTFNASLYGYHHCVRIQIIYGNPVPPQGNFVSGLHNLEIEPDILNGHSGTVVFTLRNPDQSTEPIEIVVVSQMPAGWSDTVNINGATYATSPFYVSLSAGEQVDGYLTISPAKGTPGNGTVQLQEYIGGTLIGGLEKKLQELPHGSFPVEFTESGLSSGEKWSVTFHGSTLSSSGSTIYANATNDSYPYSVTPPVGYNANPKSGTVVVSGAPVFTSITFALPSGEYCGVLSVPLVDSGTFNKSFGPDAAELDLNFSGGVSLTPTLSVCLGTTTVLGFIPEPLWLNISESLVEAVNASVNASHETNFSNLDDPYQFGDFPLGCYPLGPIPVCLEASIDLGISVDLTASAHLSMQQGIDAEASQNYSFGTGKWTSAPLSEHCLTADESLASGCASFSGGASLQGSLEVRLGPEIDIDAAGIVGVSLWPYAGLDVAAGISTEGGSPGSCASGSFGWSIAEPWVAACGILGVEVSGNVLGVFEFPGFDWNILSEPLGASVAVCAEGGSACGNARTVTPGEATTLEAYAPVTQVYFNWTSSCAAGTTPGATYAFTAPATVGTVCTLTVTTGLPLDIPLLDLSQSTVTITVEPSASVTFQEVGLPSHTSWSVTAGFDGQTQTTSAKEVVFTEPEGVVDYAITAPAGYAGALTTPASATSPITVRGPTTVTVKFGHLAKLTFREVGLPAGTAWNLTLSSKLSGGPPTERFSSTRSSLTVPVVADRYLWVVRTSDREFRAVHAHGGVGVSKSTKLVKLKFREVLSKVTFTEKGLAGHTRWSVSVRGGPTINGTGSSIKLSLPNGTYAYAVTTSNPRYTTLQQTGSLAITAPTKAKVSVTFSDPPAAPAGTGSGAGRPGVLALAAALPGQLWAIVRRW